MTLFPMEQQQLKSTSALNFRYVGLAVSLICLVLLIAYPLPPISFWQPEVSTETGYITRVDLVRLSLEKPSEDEELFVTVNLKNSSKSSAQAVLIGFRSGEEDLRFSKPKTLQNAGVLLEPAQEQKFPVAPLSEFLSAFQSKCPGCFFLGISKEVNMPVDMTVKLCKESLEKGRPCRMEYSIFPITVVKQFTTVSGDKFSGGQTVFVYLSRTTKAEYVVPKN